MNVPDFPSLWNLPANPVFRRHAAALRPWRFIPWLVVTQIVAGFFWLVTVLFYLRVREPSFDATDLGSPAFRAMLEKHGTNAFCLGWSAVMALQIFLVVFKGTFSVATGVARESNEGMMEAQRLTPVPSGHKIVGQLLGLPLLENLIVLLLIPWAVASAWLGGLSFLMMAKVYLIFATSTLFHHAVGLVAGTLIRQKILAGTLSQLMVVLLHFVLPILGGFGIGLISHLGMEAAVTSEIALATPALLKEGGVLFHSGYPQPVDFFDWKISVSGYHWIINVTMIAAFAAMLARRWNDQDSQILGKAGTTLFAAWLLTLTCGEFLPALSGGALMEMLTHGERSLSFFVSRMGNGTIGVWWLAGFSAALGLVNLVFTLSLVPSRKARSRCRHLHHAPWWHDGRNSVPWVAAISLLTAIAWILVAGTLLRETPEMRKFTLDAAGKLWIAAALAVPALALHALVLWRGWKIAMAAMFAVWIVPLMIAVIGVLMAVDLDGWPKWIGGLSGLVMPAYASFAEAAALPDADFRGVFHVSLALHAAAAVVFFLKTHRGKSA